MKLKGDEAFLALKRLAAGETAVDWEAPDAPAIERLRLAWSQPTTRTPLEVAILLRQALVFESQRRLGVQPTIIAGAGSPLQEFVEWSDVGLEASAFQGGWLITVLAWSPAWAGPIGREGLEAYAAGETPTRQISETPPAGDPFLKTLGYSDYQSAGQRAAVRAALQTPPGATLAVTLATGEGKSLIFQLIARLGFAQTVLPTPGLTVVVTPTVALAIDHENSALELGFERPIAYRGGAAEQNAALIAAIDAEEQSLCIASPEAVFGPLRGAIGRAAAKGRLKALVIDEAHLIDGWGTGFRTEFQSLSGLRREWAAASPPDRALRTILLSATLTPSTISLLKGLFSGPGPFAELSALRLRSEPDCWAAHCATEGDRQARVMEALLHVPRPAILYVTRVVDAEAWRDRLRSAGFGNVAMVHGETLGLKREEILRGWRRSEIDLVVATSAFGLGIDYRHVRSIVHACVPESLDRFYQEVGRGGRDGCSCLSLALYTDGDIAVARKISRALVISLDRGLQRWRSMYEGRQAAGPNIYDLPLDVAPSREPEDIDMRGERNSDWNARVLALLARADVLELRGSPPKEGATGSWARVHILDDEHHRQATWKAKVGPVRTALASASRRNLGLMTRFLGSGTCPSPFLLDLYGAGREAHACSRCAACRADLRVRRPQTPRLEPHSPWPPSPPGERLSALLDKGRRLIVWYNPSEIDRTFRRRFGQVLASLYLEGVFGLAFLRAPAPLVTEANEVAAGLPLFTTHIERLTQRRLPDGPQLTVLGAGVEIDAGDLHARRPCHEEILLAPAELADPMRPGGELRATYGGRMMTFGDLFARLQA